VVRQVHVNHQVGATGEELRVGSLGLCVDRFIEVSCRKELHAATLVGGWHLVVRRRARFTQ
jgi:hypothetical protein